MTMNTILLEIPVDALPTPADPPELFIAEARFLLALKLFELGRVSSGKAGRIRGMGRVEFLLAASRSGTPVVSLTADEREREFSWDD
jgi:predicted HTH domain antitoxin